MYSKSKNICILFGLPLIFWFDSGGLFASHMESTMPVFKLLYDFKRHKKDHKACDKLLF